MRQVVPFYILVLVHACVSKFKFVDKCYYLCTKAEWVWPGGGAKPWVI